MKRTGGLIEEMPVPLDEDTERVPATALALRTAGLRRFWDCSTRPETGAWSDRTPLGLLGLRRRSELLDRVGSRTRRRVSSPS